MASAERVAAEDTLVEVGLEALAALDPVASP